MIRIEQMTIKKKIIQARSPSSYSSFVEVEFVVGLELDSGADKTHQSTLGSQSFMIIKG
jgi:hypothetical protein